MLAFFSMVDARKRLHRDVMESFAGRAGRAETMIPAASDVERMGRERAPLGLFAPTGRAALAYDALWTEIRARLGGRSI